MGFLKSDDGFRGELMMVRIRKNFDAAFKAKVALEAIKGEKTLTQLTSQYKVHANQIRDWKRRVLEETPGLFSQNIKPKRKSW